jgi:hypothetical protein
MKKTGSVVLGVLCLIVFAVPAVAQDAKTVIANALKAMGDLRTVEFSATGYDFVLGQNYNGAPRGRNSSISRTRG